MEKGHIVDGPSVPYTEIKVPGLGKNLGADGIAWAVLGDNMDVDVS